MSIQSGKCSDLSIVKEVFFGEREALLIYIFFSCSGVGGSVDRIAGLCVNG